jgi:hypothetical protein
MNPDMNDGKYEMYRVVFDESENLDNGFYVSGVGLEFSGWLNETTAEYTAQVAMWAVTSFEQTCNSRPDVISYDRLT